MLDSYDSKAAKLPHLECWRWLWNHSTQKGYRAWYTPFARSHLVYGTNRIDGCLPGVCRRITSCLLLKSRVLHLAAPLIHRWKSSLISYRARRLTTDPGCHRGFRLRFAYCFRSLRNMGPICWRLYMASALCSNFWVSLRLCLRIWPCFHLHRTGKSHCFGQSTLCLPLKFRLKICTCTTHHKWWCWIGSQTL